MNKLTLADRPLLKMLCYGTLRHHFRLRADLRKLLERPLKARDSVIESLLAIGIFQLIDTRIPDHAAVSMTVEAARLLRRPKYAGLINAVLRNFLRQDIGRQEAGDDESRFNHPAWFIDALRADWPDDWQQILEANNERAPMWLRVNQNRTTTADYMIGWRRSMMATACCPDLFMQFASRSRFRLPSCRVSQTAMYRCRMRRRRSQRRGY